MDQSTQGLIRAQWARDDETARSEAREDAICAAQDHILCMPSDKLGQLIRIHAMVNPEVRKALENIAQLMATAVVDEPADNLIEAD